MQQYKTPWLNRESWFGFFQFCDFLFHFILPLPVSHVLLSTSCVLKPVFSHQSLSVHLFVSLRQSCVSCILSPAPCAPTASLICTLFQQLSHLLYVSEMKQQVACCNMVFESYRKYIMQFLCYLKSKLSPKCNLGFFCEWVQGALLQLHQNRYF